MVIGESQKVSSGYRLHWGSLKQIGDHYALRCDAKLANAEFREWEREIKGEPFQELGAFLPHPLVKGIQPEYLEEPTADSVPIVNTLSIQNLALNLSACKHIDRSQFDAMDYAKKLRRDDVLLTVDGGVSIGKAVNFTFDEDMTMDSHVVALRPEGINSLSLTYLLASPICQKQFRLAESGASGQTSVTEDDIRRFIVPSRLLENIEQLVIEIDTQRARIATEREKLDQEERELLARLSI